MASIQLWNNNWIQNSSHSHLSLQQWVYRMVKDWCQSKSNRKITVCSSLTWSRRCPAASPLPESTTNKNICPLLSSTESLRGKEKLNSSLIQYSTQDEEVLQTATTCRSLFHSHTLKARVRVSAMSVFFSSLSFSRFFLTHEEQTAWAGEQSRKRRRRKKPPTCGI